MEHPLKKAESDMRSDKCFAGNAGFVPSHGWSGCKEPSAWMIDVETRRIAQISIVCKLEACRIEHEVERDRIVGGKLVMIGN